MNVYVRELVSSLAQAGIDCTTYVRRWADDLPDEVEVEPGFRVVHISAGEPDMAKEDLPGIVDEFSHEVIEHIKAGPGVDVLHANYWLSGVAGHQIKHALDLPLVSTFHTLARVKAETGDPEPEVRVAAEIDTIGCSDAILANAPAEAEELERLYDAPPDRIEIVPPGVDHAFFAPGDQAGARLALGMGPGPILLFVGRIQRLKGLDLAVRALGALNRSDVRLVAVGGASGAQGQIEVARIKALVAELGLTDQVEFVSPKQHHELSTYYRAADALLVPSRSESFGLVALEAAACGLPVLASDVGGLRTLVQRDITGYLIADRDPVHWAHHISQVLDNPSNAASLGAAAAEMARTFTWTVTAARLRRIYADVAERAPVLCAAQ